jgi:cytochrome c peroxidase
MVACFALSVAACEPGGPKAASQDPAVGAAAFAPRSSGAAYAVDPRHPVAAAELARLGRELFFDRSLSASGRAACADCHDPGRAFAPANASAVQLAGSDGKTPGLRAVPSLRYLQTVPPFSEHFFENEGDDSIDAGPTGGRTWDGRAASAHEQASLPLLSPLEMANKTPGEVVERLRGGALAPRFRALWGGDIFDRPADAFAAAAMALEAYQETPATFQPFTSRYDAVLRGEARLSAGEARGRAAFDDPARGNCASCHPSEPKADGSAPLFSDFGYVAIGVPRNRAIPANADPGYFDLGLCGPLRQDLRDRADYCGAFRTPTLRNVATRQSFFHNGVVHDLRDAVRFYATRDSDPARWYGRGARGRARLFDDLPERYCGNVRREAPFGGKRRLSEADVRDIVAFLRTLTDADANLQAAARNAGRQTPISSISR